MTKIFANIKFSHLLLIIPGFLLLVKLGCWQLHRAEEKNQLQLLTTQQQLLPPKPYDAKKTYRSYQRVLLTGQYDNKHQFLLDNQYSAHKLGYKVYTPFLTQDKIILIERDWIARGQTRKDFPDISVSTQPQILIGSVRYPEKALLLGADESTGWPRVIQSINMTQINQYLGKPVADFVVSFDPPRSFRPERHWAYAIQWFGLAGALIIIYLLRINREDTDA